MNLFRLVFEPYESDLLASVEDGAFVFGTFNFNGDDPPSMAEAVERLV